MGVTRTITDDQPFIHLRFPNDTLRTKDLLFTQPQEVISTSQVEQVIPLMRKVESAVAAGYYAVGYVSYEAAPAFDKAYSVREEPKLPLLWYGIFTAPTDLPQKRQAGAYTVSAWTPNVSPDEYQANIQRIKQEIESGRTYQVNYTMRLHADLHGDAYAYFQDLSAAQQGFYGAYLDIGRYQIISASPELFYAKHGEEIVVKPMKGTIKRGLTFEDDRKQVEVLRASEKDRAENVMIVDLLRNDLGRIARTGSVQVSALFDIEQYYTVHQMTSTVRATLPKGSGLVDVMKALFPSGSITGAPKISTMQLIAEIEPEPREVYCGAIGIEFPSGISMYNVAIRTVIVDALTQQAQYGVGGGVTWDSTAAGEYDEIRSKAAILRTNVPPFELLETLKLTAGTWMLSERHIKRMRASAAYFNIAFDEHELIVLLDKTAVNYPVGTYKARLLLTQAGALRMEVYPLQPTDETPFVRCAKQPIDTTNRFLYHKTTHRAMYDELLEGDVFDVILWNDRGEITEFSKGNIVLKLDGRMWTPPIASGLLPGTMRAELLEKGEIHERVLHKNDLRHAKEIWFINSVRGRVAVQLADCDVGDNR